MIRKRTWEQFRDSGLLWFVNRLLQLFGWSIVFEYQEYLAESGKPHTLIEVYPARVKFRGFTEEYEDEGFCNLTHFIADHIDELEVRIKENVDEE